MSKKAINTGRTNLRLDNFRMFHLYMAAVRDQRASPLRIEVCEL